ncbi:MAG: winged helix-turn-helix domain-containing tetratricopeptide repeat protein [Woeseia sp.]
MSFDLLHGFRLGPWKIEPLRGAITGSQGEARHIEPKVMDVFVCLAEHANELVTRDELQEAVWNGRAVTDEPLTRAIGELRRALEDGGGDSQYIETVPKRGYRLIGDIYLPDGSRLDKKRARSESITQLNVHKLAFVTVTVLALALAYFAYNEFMIGPAQEDAPGTTKTQVEYLSETDGWERSVAVLPFLNMSDDPGNEYFSDGLSEEISTLLARIPGLKVIGRRSSFAFKGKNEDLRVIGQTLGVKNVLEGSVRKSGNRLRITVQLVDVSDGANIWSETYDRIMTDIFEVQDDVAAAMFDALQIHVGTAPTRGRPTESPQAYALFLKARAAMNVLELVEAKDMLLDVIELDPNFAEAYETLAFTYWSLAGWAIEAVEAQKLVREAATNAIAIDPDLVLANAFYRAADFGPHIRWRKLQAFERAARDRPNNPWILETMVYALTENGYLEEALRLCERYVELDPLSLIANTWWSAALYAVGRTEDAAAAIEFVNRWNMVPSTYRLTLDGISLVEKRDETAIAQFEAYVRQDSSDSGWVRDLITNARHPVSGQAYLDDRIPQIVASMSEEGLTSLYLFFGFLDRHFELILATEPSDSTWHLAGIHLWRGNVFRRTGFTAHPKYLDLVNSLGIIESWEQRGPPDFCEKVSGEWVCI